MAIVGMEHSVVLLGGGADAVGIAARVREMGLLPIIVDQDPKCPAKDYGIFVRASCYDKDETLGALDFYSSQESIRCAAVLCAGTDAVRTMAAVAGEYGLIGPSQFTADLSSDKLAQKKRLQAAGVDVPRFTGDPLEARSWSTPIVVKPADSRGARGVMRISSDSDLRFDRAVEMARSFSRAGRVIVERWIFGIQLSSESLIQGGKILWTAFAERNYSRLEQLAPHVIEDGSDMPPTIPAYFEKDWKAIAEEALLKCASALGLTDGTLKGDLVWDGQKIWVIEVAARLSGGRFCSDMTPAVWGVDFVGMAVRIALGERIYPGEIRPWLRRRACQRFIFPPGKSITCHPDRGPMTIGYGPNREDARRNAEAMLERYSDSS